MAQRNPINERYQGDGPAGKSRKSAASAKPKAEAAASVYIEKKPETPRERKAAQRRRAAEKQRKDQERLRRTKEKERAARIAAGLEVEPIKKKGFLESLVSPRTQPAQAKPAAADTNAGSSAKTGAGAAGASAGASGAAAGAKGATATSGAKGVTATGAKGAVATGTAGSAASGAKGTTASTGAKDTTASTAAKGTAATGTVSGTASAVTGAAAGASGQKTATPRAAGQKTATARASGAKPAASTAVSAPIPAPGKEEPQKTGFFSRGPNLKYPQTPEYKKLRKYYWTLMGVALVAVLISLVTQMSGFFPQSAWMVCLGVAYLCAIGGIILDVVKIRPMVKVHTEQFASGKKTPKQIKHETEAAAYARELQLAREAEKTARRSDGRAGLLKAKNRLSQEPKQAATQNKTEADSETTE